jgi:hypothetical protein
MCQRHGADTGTHTLDETAPRYDVRALVLHVEPP